MEEILPLAPLGLRVWKETWSNDRGVSLYGQESCLCKQNANNHCDDMNALPSSLQSPKVTQIGTRHGFWEVHKAGYIGLMWLISTATQRYETIKTEL